MPYRRVLKLLTTNRQSSAVVFNDQKDHFRFLRTMLSRFFLEG